MEQKEEEFYLSCELGFVEEKGKFVPAREEFPYALFQAGNSFFPFFQCENFITQLNDFIYYNNQFLLNKKGEAKKRLEEALANKNHYYAEELDFLIDSSYSWDWLVDIVNKGNIIVLLLSFLEGCLKHILKYYSEETKFVCKKREKGTGKIEYYISQISDCCFVDISSSCSEELNIIEQAKEIRNIFVHEWDFNEDNDLEIPFEEKVKCYSVTKLINSISIILEACEFAGIASL